MPYTRSYRSRPRRTYRRKKTYKAVNKYAQRKQINSVARQVRILRAQSRKLIKLGSAENSVEIKNPCTCIELTDLNKLSRIFDDQGGSYASTNSKLYLDKLNVDMKISPGTEWSQVDMTVFIVSLKSASARDVLHDTGGMVTFQKEIDYWDWTSMLGAPQGMTMLNLRRFNIHMAKRVYTSRLTTVAPQTTNGTTSGQLNYSYYPDSGVTEQHRIYKKINLVGRNWSVKNSCGPWTALDNDTKDPTGRLWILIFNNNYATDGEYPMLNYTNIITAHEM